MISKIALGTVQFGLDYGINNQRGKIPYQEVVDILKFCDRKGIRLLDTATAYGDSEHVIGAAIKETRTCFDVVTKLPNIDSQSINEVVHQSAKNLNKDTVYGVLFHSFKQYRNSPIQFDELAKLKNDGIINKIGFSLYHLEEVEVLLEKELMFDIVQVPYNIFDRRFESIFEVLKNRGIEIHTRSAFLQGLFFKEIDSLEKCFSPIKSKLKELREVFKENKIPLSAGLLNFSLLNDKIDKVVIGVDSIDNLKENANAINYMEQTKAIYDQLKQYEVNDLNIILPTNWGNVG